MATLLNLDPGSMEHIQQGRAKLAFVTGPARLPSASPKWAS